MKPNTENKTMKITSLKNENGARVYHVIDDDPDGCIQEFWTYKSAQEYVEYITRLNEVTLEEAINAYEVTL